jgi:hypothetical protein
VTPQRWRQINDLFHKAAEREAPARQQLLEETSRTDPELAAEVRSLLAVHESADGLLEEPAWAVDPTLILETAAPLATGTVLGPYRIVREIGRGGMGVVYEAEDTRLLRPVALKVLPREYARDPLRRERLTREARAAAALAHPSIATVHALDEVDGTLFLVSELVRGETLREELRRGAVPPVALVPTLVQLASGLAAAHDAGIVHRDFKPENIVRCPDGRVKILDFGLAHMTDPGMATEWRLTQAGMAIGTPGYMSPEQLAGQEVDARTDVFAFGVVAWELATGTHPFGTNAAELLARMTDLMEGRPVTAAGPGLPVPALEPLLRRCMRRAPGERYRSAGEILVDLERIRTNPSSGGIVTTQGEAGGGLWWWQFHQGLMAAVIASMPVAAWFLRRWDPAVGSRVFLLVLALATVSVTIRLNLFFTSRVHPSHLSSQRGRVFKAMTAAEVVLGLVLLVSAAVVRGPHDALAGTLVTLAVVMLASLVIIEPATTAAALGHEEG